MRIILIILIGLMVSNCSNTYVKNKKNISSPNDLMKFTNVWCEKNKSTDKIIRMCGQGWSKDLTISEQKAIMDSKLKIADITQHSLIKNEKIELKEIEKLFNLLKETFSPMKLAKNAVKQIISPV